MPLIDELTYLLPAWLTTTVEADQGPTSGGYLYFAPLNDASLPNANATPLHGGTVLHKIFRGPTAAIADGGLCFGNRIYIAEATAGLSCLNDVCTVTRVRLLGATDWHYLDARHILCDYAKLLRPLFQARFPGLVAYADAIVAAARANVATTNPTLGLPIGQTHFPGFAAAHPTGREPYTAQIVFDTYFEEAGAPRTGTPVRGLFQTLCHDSAATSFTRDFDYAFGARYARLLDMTVRPVWEYSDAALGQNAGTLGHLLAGQLVELAELNSAGAGTTIINTISDQFESYIETGTATPIP